MKTLGSIPNTVTVAPYKFKETNKECNVHYCKMGGISQYFNIYIETFKYKVEQDQYAYKAKAIDDNYVWSAMVKINN